MIRTNRRIDLKRDNEKGICGFFKCSNKLPEDPKGIPGFFGIYNSIKICSACYKAMIEGIEDDCKKAQAEMDRDIFRIIDSLIK